MITRVEAGMRITVGVRERGKSCGGLPLKYLGLLSDSTRLVGISKIRTKLMRLQSIPETGGLHPFS